MDGARQKHEQAALYAGGEYFALSAVLEPAAEALVDAAGVGPQHAVLDVAAGDGNAAIAAARRGARVVATDLSPAQVERGRARTAALGLDVGWRSADAESLPFADDAFDRVVSSFGAVAAPDAARTAAELCRVCRPGGSVALTAWPPDSFMGRLVETVRALVPEFPDPEHGWGVEAIARRYLEPHADVTRCERRTLPWDPHARAAAGAADFTAVYLGARVPADELQRLRRRVAADFLEPDGTLRADYLLVVARVRGGVG